MPFRMSLAALAQVEDIEFFNDAVGRERPNRCELVYLAKGPEPSGNHGEGWWWTLSFALQGPKIRAMFGRSGVSRGWVSAVQTQPANRLRIDTGLTTARARMLMVLSKEKEKQYASEGRDLIGR
jgi:hypothetical protein